MTKAAFWTKAQSLVLFQLLFIIWKFYMSNHFALHLYEQIEKKAESG